MKTSQIAPTYRHCDKRVGSMEITQIASIHRHCDPIFKYSKELIRKV